MAVIRTDSMSMIWRNVERYKRCIFISSVFVIITSIVEIVMSAILITIYLFPSLQFWHPFFVITPYLMLALGIYKFIVAVYGFTISGSKRRVLLISFCVLLSIAFIIQIGLTAIFWLTIAQFDSKAKTYHVLNKYGEDEMITDALDYMQQHLRCCGLRYDEQRYESRGYAAWEETSYGKNTSGVPDSCCRTYSKDCGKDIFPSEQQKFKQINSRIFVEGCLGILTYWMKEVVEPMLGVYSGFGVAISLIELIAVVLVSAYVAQISRSRRRQNTLGNLVLSGSGKQDMGNIRTTDRA